MSYTKLLLVAPAWLEVLDPETNTMTLKAEGDASAACQLQVDPIPGTDPVQYTYSCISVTCDQTCVLRRQVTPTGVKHWCECR